MRTRVGGGGLTVVHRQLFLGIRKHQMNLGNVGHHPWSQVEASRVQFSNTGFGTFLKKPCKHYHRNLSTTRGYQNAWRKATFQYAITSGTFIKRRATTFEIVPQTKGIFKGAKWHLGSRCPSSYSILKASIASRILTTTGDTVLNQYMNPRSAEKSSCHLAVHT